nr:hypothetical protein [Tanacetum cinerariifolium]
YYSCATGEAAPKPKASARKKTSSSALSITPPTPIATPTPTTTVVAAPRLSAAAKGKQPARATTLTEPTDVERTEAEQLKIVLKWSRQETPRVPDVPSDDSEEELSWDSSDDENMDEQTKGREESEGEKTDESDDDNDDDDDEEETTKIGKRPSRATTTAKPTDLQRSEAEQLKLALKRSRHETHISQQIGSGTCEGTGSKPGVPDVPSDDSKEEISCKSSEDEEVGGQEEGNESNDDKSTILKRRREDVDQKGPFAGSDQGSKRQREEGEHASASTPYQPATRNAGRTTTGSQSRQLSASESAFAKEPVQPTCQMEEPSHPVFETDHQHRIVIGTNLCQLLKEKLNHG